MRSAYTKREVAARDVVLRSSSRPGRRAESPACPSAAAILALSLTIGLRRALSVRSAAHQPSPVPILDLSWVAGT